MKSYYQKNLYKVLEISYTENEEEIKHAFRQLARKYHPDVNKDDICIVKFKEIKEAYEVLTDPKEKNYYDRYRGYTTAKTHETKTAQKAYKSSSYSEKRTYSPPPNVKKEEQKDYQTKTNKETKEPFSRVFNDIFDGLFTSEKGEKHQASQKSKKQKREDGQNITMKIQVSYIESLNGTNRKVNILHTERCPNCGGKRFINGAICPYCKGKGEISLHKKLNVKIPAGVVQDTKIRIAGEGNKGISGGKNGDLFLTVDIENNTFFQYEGRNVLCEIPITPYEAALGTNIEIPTLDGKVMMKIPPLTSSGQKFRLPREGILDPDTSIRGDQVVTIKIELPKALSLEEIQLYEKLKELSSDDIRKDLKNAK